MLTIYVFLPAGGNSWQPTKHGPAHLTGMAFVRAHQMEPFDEPWVVPEVEWIEPHEPPPVSQFAGWPVYRPGDDVGLDRYFASGDQLPLGGDAEGLVIGLHRQQLSRCVDGQAFDPVGDQKDRREAQSDHAGPQDNPIGCHNTGFIAQEIACRHECTFTR